MPKADADQSVYNPGPKIRAFIAKSLLPPEAKSDEVFLIKDAEWNIEAALNLGQINPNARFDETRYDEVSFEATTDGDYVTDADTYLAYTRMQVDLDALPMAAYEQATVIDVTSTVIGTVVTFKAKRYIGKNPDVPLGYGPPNTTFTSSYRSRTTALGCIQNLPPGDQIIKDRINQGLGIYPCCLTDVEIWSVTAYVDPLFPQPVTQVDNGLIPATYYPNPNEDPTNPRDNYLVFLSEWVIGDNAADAEPCLTASDMTMLTQGGYDVMLDVWANYVVNENVEPISTNFQGGRVEVIDQFPPPYQDRQFYHKASFLFGRWYDDTLEEE